MSFHVQSSTGECHSCRLINRGMSFRIDLSKGECHSTSSHQQGNAILRRLINRGMSFNVESSTGGMSFGVDSSTGECHSEYRHQQRNVIPSGLSGCAMVLYFGTSVWDSVNTGTQGQCSRAPLPFLWLCHNPFLVDYLGAWVWGSFRGFGRQRYRQPLPPAPQIIGRCKKEGIKNPI
jgi:hypothetical protein